MKPKQKKPIGLLIFFSVLLSIVIINACHKAEQQANKPEVDYSALRTKFFTITPGTDPTVAAIAASIQRQDAKRKFIPLTPEL